MAPAARVRGPNARLLVYHNHMSLHLFLHACLPFDCCVLLVCLLFAAHLDSDAAFLLLVCKAGPACNCCIVASFQPSRPASPPCRMSFLTDRPTNDREKCEHSTKRS